MRRCADRALGRHPSRRREGGAAGQGRAQRRSCLHRARPVRARADAGASGGARRGDLLQEAVHGGARGMGDSFYVADPWGNRLELEGTRGLSRRAAESRGRQVAGRASRGRRVGLARRAEAACWPSAPAEREAQAPPAAVRGRRPSGCPSARRRSRAAAARAGRCTKEIWASAATLIAAERSVRCAAAEIASGKMALVPTPSKAEAEQRHQRRRREEDRGARRPPSRRAGTRATPVGECRSTKLSAKKRVVACEKAKTATAKPDEEGPGVEDVAHVDRRPVHAGALHQHRRERHADEHQDRGGRPREPRRGLACSSAARFGAGW